VKTKLHHLDELIDKLEALPDEAFELTITIRGKKHPRIVRIEGPYSHDHEWLPRIEAILNMVRNENGIKP